MPTAIYFTCSNAYSRIEYYENLNWFFENSVRKQGVRRFQARRAQVKSLSRAKMNLFQAPAREQFSHKQRLITSPPKLYHRKNPVAKFWRGWEISAPWSKIFFFLAC